MSPKNLILGGVGVVFAIIALVFLGNSGTVVDQTEHCVGTRWGAVTEDKMPVGFNFTILTKPTCFSLQETNYPSGKGETEEFTAVTRDPVEITGNVAVVYQFQNVKQLFLDKRDAANAEIQMHNALRNAVTDAAKKFTNDELFGPKGSAFNDSVKSIAQRTAGDGIKFVHIYLTGMRPPKSIADARVIAVAKETQLQAAIRQLQIDSANARGVVIKAEAAARESELKNRAMASSPTVVELEKAKAMAAGIAGICGQSTTCIIGGNVMDKYLNAFVRP